MLNANNWHNDAIAFQIRLPAVESFFHVVDRNVCEGEKSFVSTLITKLSNFSESDHFLTKKAVTFSFVFIENLGLWQTTWQ